MRALRVDVSAAMGALGIAEGAGGLAAWPAAGAPCVRVPVVPMGVPLWVCWPAAVAGFGDVVLGGVPCADARPESEIKAKALAVVAMMRRMGERFMKSLRWK